MTKWIIQERETDCYLDDVYFQDLLGNCAIYGNRELKSFVPEWFEKLVLNEQWLEYALDDIDHFKTDLGMTLVDAVNKAVYQDLDLQNDYNQSVTTVEDATTIYNALKEHYYNSDLNETCYLLKAITGKVWDFETIAGYSQSDWNYLFYPEDEHANSRMIEAEYFGCYLEYSIYENDVNDDTNLVDFMRVYDFQDIEEQAKLYLQDLYQDGDTVELWTISGYIRVANYNKTNMDLH